MTTAFVLTLVLTRKQQNPQAQAKNRRAILLRISSFRRIKATLRALTDGVVKPIEESTDGTFREKMMGDGFVLFPKDEISAHRSAARSNSSSLPSMRSGWSMTTAWKC